MTNPREKGKRLEREVVRLLKAWSGDQGFARTAFSRGRRTRTEDIKKPLWFCASIEAKNREGWSWERTLLGEGPVWEWWEQAIAQAEDGEVPILVFTRARQKLWCFVPDLVVGHLSGGATLRDCARPGLLAPRLMPFEDLLATTTPDFWARQ